MVAKKHELALRPKVIEPPPNTDGRSPPNDVDAEAAVLSACMLDPIATETIAGLIQPEHFYSEAHRWIFTACVEVAAIGRPVDVVTVGTWLKDHERIAQVGGMAYLTEILDAAPAVRNVATYAETVFEKWRIRSTIATCQRVAAQGYFDVGEAQSFIGSLVEGMEKLLDLRTGLAFESARQILAMVEEDTTDDLIIPRLGFGPGRTAMLGGDSYTGKSVIACDIAIAVATGRRVFNVFSVAKPGLVRWLNYDQPAKLARRRFRRMWRALGLDDQHLDNVQFSHFPDFHLDDDAAVSVLCRIFRGCKLGIIDALVGSVDHTPEKDEAIGRILLRLMHVSHKTGCAFLVIHHTIKPPPEYAKKNEDDAPRKMTTRAASTMLRGNRAIFAACDSVIVLESQGKKKPVRVYHEKAPHDGNALDDFFLMIEDVEEPDDTIAVDFMPAVDLLGEPITPPQTKSKKRTLDPKWGIRVRHIDPEELETDRKKQGEERSAKAELDAQRAFEQLCKRVLETVKAHPGIHGADLKERLGKCSKNRVYAALRTLQKDGKLSETKEGRKDVWRAI